MAFSSSNPSSASMASINLDESPRVTDHHPLDPGESFVHIDPPIVESTVLKRAEQVATTKDGSSTNLEDGWDLVEEFDDRPAPSSNQSMAKSSNRNQTKPKEPNPSKSRSTGLSTSRGASSMPPLSTSTSSKSELSGQAGQILSPKGANEGSSRRRSKSGSKPQNAEMTSNSGFKHRIYCTLYNFYHAQPSEAPVLSNAPIYMMGAILTSTGDLDGTPKNSPSSQAQYGGSYRGKEKSSSGKNGDLVSKTSKDEFLEMCRSLIFFSYRKDFARLEGFNVTSDVGWGCMLRTGQMLLATALQRLHEPLFYRASLGDRGLSNGRGWNGRMPVGQELMTSGNSQIISQLILDWFRDSPDMDRHPYAIHNLVRASLALNPSSDGAVSGPSWFSPTKLARILRFLVRVHSPERLTMYVPPEGVIYVDEVVALCTEPYTSTLSPPTKNAHSDRTFLWWKRYSANGPSVARSLTIPDYDDNDASDGEENDIDFKNLENDALYQRALAESIAQYESESHHRSPSSTPNNTSFRGNQTPSDSSLLSWTTRDWASSATSPVASLASSNQNSMVNRPSTSDSQAEIEEKAFRKRSSSANTQQHPTGLTLPPQQASSAAVSPNSGSLPRLTESEGAIPRNHSIGSSNSLEASSTWVQLSNVSSTRSSLEPIPGFAPLPMVTSLAADPLDEYFVTPEPVVSSFHGPLNLSAIVENHEELSGSPKIKLPLQEWRNESSKEPWNDFGSPTSPQLSQSPNYLSPPSHLVHQAQTTTNRLLASYQATSATGWSAPFPSPSSSISSGRSPSPLTPSGGYFQGNNPSPYSSMGSNDEFGGSTTNSKRSGILEDTVFVMVPENSTPPQTMTLGQMSISPGASTGLSPMAATTSSHSNFGNPTPSPSSNMSAQPFVAPNECWRPLLLLIPSRLGINKVNPAYIEHLKFSLSSASSVGIVGGKPNKSLYFFAFQEDYVFYLDPHFVHNTVKPIDSKGQVHDSYKVKFPQKIKFLDLDPSLALGFFIRTRADFEAFLQAHHTFAIQAQDDPSTESIFTIQDTAPDYLKR